MQSMLDKECWKGIEWFKEGRQLYSIVYIERTANMHSSLYEEGSQIQRTLFPPGTGVLSCSTLATEVDIEQLVSVFRQKRKNMQHGDSTDHIPLA